MGRIVSVQNIDGGVKSSGVRNRCVHEAKCLDFSARMS